MALEYSLLTTGNCKKGKDGRKGQDGNVDETGQMWKERSRPHHGERNVTIQLKLVVYVSLSKIALLSFFFCFMFVHKKMSDFQLHF